MTDLTHWWFFCIGFPWSEPKEEQRAPGFMCEGIVLTPLSLASL